MKPYPVSYWVMKSMTTLKKKQRIELEPNIRGIPALMAKGLFDLPVKRGKISLVSVHLCCTSGEEYRRLGLKKHWCWDYVKLDFLIYSLLLFIILLLHTVCIYVNAIPLSPFPQRLESSTHPSSLTKDAHDF